MIKKLLSSLQDAVMANDQKLFEAVVGDLLKYNTEYVDFEANILAYNILRQIRSRVLVGGPNDLIIQNAHLTADVVENLVRICRGPYKPEMTPALEALVLYWESGSITPDGLVPLEEAYFNET
jgi:hypothetical protein